MPGNNDQEHHLGYLVFFVPCLLKGVNLVSFFSGDVCLVHFDIDKELFREEALKLEHDTSGWRGLFLCSAFVVEAIKPE